MPEPERWDCYSTGILTEAEIEEKRQSMAPSLFAANYELKHIAAEDALFKEPPKFITEAIAREVLQNENAKPEDLLRDGIAHLDAAYGGGDGTAFTCGAMRVSQSRLMATPPACGRAPSARSSGRPSCKASA